MADISSITLPGGGTYDLKDKNSVPKYGMGKNLMDNWYFGNPVNQRGKSSYTAPGGQNYYTIDRWFVYSAGTVVSVGSGSITLGPRSEGASSMAENLGIPFSDVAGKSMSVSCLLDDGSFISASNTLPTTAPSSNTILISAYGPSGSSGYFARLGYNNGFYFILQAPTNTSLSIVAVKLELGTESTLCHNEGTDETPVWVLNEVPDYEYELYRCITSTADPSDTYANKTLATRQDLTNIQATGTTNTTGAAILAGAYFYLNGILHRAKTQIDQNATFTVNTNCTKVTEGGLNSLSKLAHHQIQNGVDVWRSGNTVIFSISAGSYTTTENSGVLKNSSTLAEIVIPSGYTIESYCTVTDTLAGKRLFTWLESNRNRVFGQTQWASQNLRITMTWFTKDAWPDNDTI